MQKHKLETECKDVNQRFNALELKYNQICNMQ